jgi:uncharacterized protein (TIGR02246 family)
VDVELARRVMTPPPTICEAPVHQNVREVSMRSIVIGVTALVLGCQPSNNARETADAPSDVNAAADTVEAASGIDSLEARFIAAYNRDDPKALAETYTEDVRFIQDGTVEEGRARMEEGWRANAAALSDVKLTTVERVIRGDVGVLTQRFTQQYRTSAGKTVTDSGYFVGMVRRDPDGQWRYHSVVLSRPPEK